MCVNLDQQLLSVTHADYHLLVAMPGARDLIFRVGFEPTSDYLHLVLPPRKMLAAAHAKKALLVAYDTTQGKLG